MMHAALIVARAVVLAVAVVLAYRALPATFAMWDTDAPLQWWAGRSTGFVAYVALALSMVFGLMVSSRGLDGAIARKTILEHHQQWTVAAIVATVAHVLVVATDQYVEIGLRGALLPGQAADLTGPVALGVVAWWALIVLVLSSWLRGAMSYTVWRVVHAVAFGGFLLGLLHGLTAGTDSALVPVRVLYAGSGGVVLGAVVFRLLYVARRKPAAAPAPASSAPVAPAG